MFDIVKKTTLSPHNEGNSICCALNPKFFGDFVPKPAIKVSFLSNQNPGNATQVSGNDEYCSEWYETQKLH